MFPSSNFPDLKERQRGSGLVVALFIMIVMLALVLALGRIMQSSQSSIVYEVQGSRALMAAQSGAELELTKVFPLAGGNACDAASTWNFNALGIVSFSGCIAEVSCEQNSQTINSETYSLYKITSTGTCSDGGFTASRTIEVEARQ